MNKNMLEKIKLETLREFPELNEPHKNLHEKEVRVVLKKFVIIKTENI